MTGNKDDASDITQDTFIQGFKSIDKFRGESQIYTWLYKIAKNKCLRLLEKKNKTTFLSLQTFAVSHTSVHGSLQTILRHANASRSHPGA